ncbi:MAG: DUF5666 domain-containing protein [bacterium]
MNTKQTRLTHATAIVTLLIAMLFVVQAPFAQSPTRMILREQRRELIQEKKQIDVEKTKNILEQVKNIIKEKIKRQISGKLVTIAGTVLTVQKDQTTYTVTTTDSTVFKRRFGASSSLSEFSPNDQLLIIGNRKKNNDGTLSSTDIEASYIRNMSIQRRFAVFNGEVASISGDTLTLQTKGRGVQIAYVSNKTQYKEKNVLISFSSIKVGDTLIVKGELWDRANNKIDAKTILRLVNKRSTITPIQPIRVTD